MYIVAMATRLKRKVFLSGNIRADISNMVRIAADENGCVVKELMFRDYGIAVLLECEDRRAAEQVVRGIRYSTSGTIRRRYPELWGMPSFWTRKTLILETDGWKDSMEEIDRFYASLKSR